MKLLLIEDDITLSNNLKKILIKQGFAVDVAHKKESGLYEIDVNEYDCVILDINLPDGSGFDFLKRVRQRENQTPVIIMTARGDVEDRIKGLNLGADDYVAKPFDSNELIARIRAVIRRGTRLSLPVITVGDLTIVPAEHTAKICGHTLDLTAKEFSVLEYLCFHSKQLITRSMLMEHIWGSDFETFSNVIDVYIRNLRRKIGKYSSKQIIRTIRGKGYILG